MLFKGPADIAVEEVHAILRQIVARTIAGEECKQLAQYTQLKREIATCAANALEAMKEEARKMVLTLVEMERSYLTAEVFKEILQQNGRSETGEVIRTLSGRQARMPPAAWSYFFGDWHALVQKSLRVVIHGEHMQEQAGRASPADGLHRWRIPWRTARPLTSTCARSRCMSAPTSRTSARS